MKQKNTIITLIVLIIIFILGHYFLVKPTEENLKPEQFLLDNTSEQIQERVDLEPVLESSDDPESFSQELEELTNEELDIDREIDDLEALSF